MRLRRGGPASATPRSHVLSSPSSNTVAHRVARRRRVSTAFATSIFQPRSLSRNRHCPNFTSRRYSSQRDFFTTRLRLDGYIPPSRGCARARKSCCESPATSAFARPRSALHALSPCASTKFMKPIASRAPRPKIYVPRRGIMRRN